MPTPDTTKPPQAGPGGEGASGKKINSNSGWNALTHTLGHHVPRELRNAKNTRKAIYRLIRTGR